MIGVGFEELAGHLAIVLNSETWTPLESRGCEGSGTGEGTLPLNQADMILSHQATMRVLRGRPEGFDAAPYQPNDQNNKLRETGPL